MATLMDIAKEQLATLDVKALLALHNKLTGKDTKRFATRAAGEKATLKAFETTSDKGALVKFTSGPEKPAKKQRDPKEPKAPASSADRSAAISASWKDKNVHAARSKKDRVTADGVEYRSLGKAYAELKIETKAFIKERMQLKADGKMNIHGHKFAIVAG